MASKKEMTLSELAKKDLKVYKKTEEQIKRQKIFFKTCSITLACTIISAAAGTIAGLKKNDEKTDHLDNYCIYCNMFGLKHQQKMIDKQYGEAIDTDLIDNNRLNVYYVDDENEKHLIKSFITGNKGGK